MSLGSNAEELMFDVLSNLSNLTTTTTSPDSSSGSKPIAYVALGISILFFGSNFVPAAKFPIGDGISFQFFLCCGIWIVGIIVNLIVATSSAAFHFFPLVMIGGVIWTTGNVLSTFVIPINGLGVSMLLWCTTNLFMGKFQKKTKKSFFISSLNKGWASGRFGWFGLKPDNVSNSALNYAGVVIAILSGAITLFIRIGKKEDLEHQSLVNLEDSTTINTSIDAEQPQTNVKKVSFQMRIIGYILAIVAGLFFGLNVSPTTYIIQHNDDYQDYKPKVSKNGLNYVFPHYTGILLTSFFYYVIYIIAKKNKPHIDIQSILPAFISGNMWGIAQAALIYANGILGQSISFPLVSVGPAVIAGLWSIFYIKDIYGWKNYLIFTVGTVIRAVACVLIALSDKN